jgi:spore coat polysaccharide biosynthesis predicted glycosyltransferase SpsG
MVSELLLETYLPIVCGKNKSIRREKRDIVIIDAYARQ